MEHKWYVVHTASGMEAKAVGLLENMVKVEDLQDISEIIIPMHKEFVYQNGKRKEVFKKSSPGYILVKIVYSKFIEDKIKNTLYVSGFVIIPGNDPKPLSSLEFSKFVKTEKNEEESEGGFITLEFDKGDNVLIIDGPFNNFSGKVNKIHPDKKKIVVDVEIFGRITPVEIDYYKVKKL